MSVDEELNLLEVLISGLKSANLPAKDTAAKPNTEIDTDENSMMMIVYKSRLKVQYKLKECLVKGLWRPLGRSLKRMRETGGHCCKIESGAVQKLFGGRSSSLIYEVHSGDAWAGFLRNHHCPFTNLPQSLSLIELGSF